MVETDSTHNDIDQLLNDLGGCGRFQVTIIFFIYCVKFAASMSMMMMAFGNYNPGWKCLNNSIRDNVTITSIDLNSNNTDECTVFDSCTNVQFPRGVSTVVSEWSLVCDRSWISSLIISLQMLGVLIGAYLSGYLGDKIGRRRTIYAVTFYHTIVNIIAIFSNSWQMFASMRFFIGLAIPNMLYLTAVYGIEFVQHKWRNAIIHLPVWSTGCLALALVAMTTEDWRYVHCIVASASFISLLPVFWMPESLRWLVVKDKTEKAAAVINKIALINGKSKPDIGTMQTIANQNRDQLKSHACTNLLRKGFRYPTVVFGITLTSMGIIYYAISFSVKSLPGEIYTNLLITFASEIPMTIVSTILPNYTGRKIAIIVFLTISTLSLFMIVGLDLRTGGLLRSTGMLISALVARMTVSAAWDTTVTYMGELFPTVIRSTSIAYTNWISRIGAIIAPYFIPDDPDTYFINYLFMALCALICCSLIIFVPETKGRALQDTWALEEPQPFLRNKTLIEKEFRHEETRCV